MSLYSQGIVTVKATVEKAENGYIVDFGTARRVALDELGLAAVFEDWPAPPAAVVGDGRAGDIHANLVGLIQLGTSVPETEPRRTVDRDASASPETIVRTPVADDGTEYAPVRQEGPNHFVVDCPSHGEKRMERQGTNWRCTGQTNKQACTVVIPRSVIGRFFAG